MNIELSGIVTRYNGNGRKLGYPTANITVPDDAGEGVFIGTVSLRGMKLPAMIFIGAPMVYKETLKRAEAHILDFEDEDLYGEKVTFTILEKIRDNQDFNSEQELIAAMEVDKHATYDYFANNSVT